MLNGKDISNNESGVSTLTVSNIDKVSPIDPTIIPSTTVLVENLQVTIDYPSDAIEKKYTLNGGLTWIDYTGVITLTDNKVVSAKCKDLVGNWSNTVNYTINNINHAPTAVITMTPSTNIKTDTNIVFSKSNSTDVDGDSIISEEWQLDSNNVVNTPPNGIISVAGSHTIKLRVKDSNNIWSSWTTQTFSVSLNTVTVKWDLAKIYGTVTFSNNNMTALVSGNPYGAAATRSVSSGKWYFEIKLDSGYHAMLGVIGAGTTQYSWQDTKARSWYSDGGYYTGTSYAGNTTYTAGNTIGVAVDMDNGTLDYYKNGTLVGRSFTDLKILGSVSPYVSAGATGGPCQYTINFGDTPFVGTIPSGYKAYNSN